LRNQEEVAIAAKEPDTAPSSKIAEWLVNEFDADTDMAIYAAKKAIDQTPTMEGYKAVKMNAIKILEELSNTSAKRKKSEQTVVSKSGMISMTGKKDDGELAAYNQIKDEGLIKELTEFGVKVEQGVEKI
jgi:hypothetical protein